MKIALIGYGKMGQEIERFAVQRGHEIVLAINDQNINDFTTENIKKADVAIDFSTPNSVISNIYKCFEAHIPIVVGTTGWYHEIEKIKKDCILSNNSFLYGSNFSVGVNIFFELNKYLAKLMNQHLAYDIQIEEIHHTQKLDAPSGTAITLAEDILNRTTHKTEWINEVVGNETDKVIKNNQLLIESLRIDNVTGTHSVLYSSEIDKIEIKHTAHNRSGFALGAVIAAEWLQNNKGFFSVADVFNFKNE